MGVLNKVIHMEIVRWANGFGIFLFDYICVFCIYSKISLNTFNKVYSIFHYETYKFFNNNENERQQRNMMNIDTKFWWILSDPN